MQNYVLGFLYSNDLEYVLLQEKKKPGWQAGRLNGIGGKIEGYELPHEAMDREATEETTIEPKLVAWRPVGTMTDRKNWKVCLYSSRYKGSLASIESKEDEPLFMIEVEDLTNHKNVICNLEFLVPLCRQSIADDIICSIEY